MADNYEIAKHRTATYFLTYDQNVMAGRRGAVMDEENIYITFVGSQYRIDRNTGIVWRMDGSDTEAGYNEAMTIYDALCDAKPDFVPAGKYSHINRMKGVAQTSGLGEGFHKDYACMFAQDPDRFAHCCERLGGMPYPVGDRAYTVPIFEDLYAVVQLWLEDEDFPANLCVLWDEHVLDCIRYETTYFVLGHLLSKLTDMMKTAEG